VIVLSANPALGQKVTNPSDQKFHAYVSQGVREGALILTVALCAFLLMALGSHSANDPGWTSTGTQSVPLNYGGRAGAWLSDILLCFFCLLYTSPSPRD